MKIEYKPIGYVRSPYNNLKDMPIQPHYAKDITGEVEIFPEYELGLKDLGGFSHLLLVCHLHISSAFHHQVVPGRSFSQPIPSIPRDFAVTQRLG